MEILIKAKQSNNPQFEFLNQNNRLNRYYKHLLAAIKNNVYPKIDEIDKDEKLNETFSDEKLANNFDQHLNPIEEQPMVLLCFLCIY